MEQLEPTYISADQFFDRVERIRQINPESLFVVDLGKSSRENGTISVSRPGCSHSAVIPAAAVERMLPLAFIHDSGEPRKTLMSLEFKKEFASLSSSVLPNNGNGLLLLQSSQLSKVENPGLRCFRQAKNAWEDSKRSSFSSPQATSLEDGIGVKVSPGRLKFALPRGANGTEIIAVHVAFGGVWEAVVGVTGSDGFTALGSCNSNAYKHGMPGNTNGFFIPLPVPFAPDFACVYTISCNFKRGEWRPDLQWEAAPVGVRGPNYNFGFWYPEDPNKYPEPAANSIDGWAVSVRIGN